MNHDFEERAEAEDLLERIEAEGGLGAYLEWSGSIYPSSFPPELQREVLAAANALSALEVALTEWAAMRGAHY